jgi:beta-lactamase class A
MLNTHLNESRRALSGWRFAGLPHTLTACAATAAMASLVACSPTGTPAAGMRTPSMQGNAPAAALAAPPPEHPDATLARALKPILRDSDARLAVAVLDLDGGDRRVASYQGDARFDAASIIKVDILAALLLDAQDTGRELTSEEREAAEAMISTSDNEAAHLLWRRIGEGEGLDSANKRLGLASTLSGPGTLWGLTQTTAKDQTRLLRSVFAPESGNSTRAREEPALSSASRAYIRDLMGSIERGQDWGVSAAASRWALKNGWLQRSTTGLWDINSIGQVTVQGRRYLVSVLSSGNASMEDGVSLVEQAVEATVGWAGSRARRWPLSPDCSGC